MESQKELLTLKETAEILGVSIFTVRNMIKANAITGKGFGPGGRVRYVTRRSLESYLNGKEG